MGNDKKTPVTINDKEYLFEDLTQEQQALFNHIIDLNRKIASSQFNLDQLQVGRQAFLTMLEANLAANKEAEQQPAAVEQTVQ